VAVTQADGPDAPLTDLDMAILDGVRQRWEAADPMPSDLVDRIQFAIDLNAIDVEVSRLVELHEPVATRADEHPRLITFQSASLSIMVSFDPRIDGTQRIDGWITPGDAHRVELRSQQGSRFADADNEGRFSLEDVTPGVVQLVVHLAGNSRRVITPSLDMRPEQ
jgi:hypothetical protein